MRNYIYILAIIPLISYSQIGIGISGTSSFTTGQTIFPGEEAIFETVNYELRNNSIGLDWNTGRRFIIGEIWCMIGMTYNVSKTFYNFAESNIPISNYEIIERRLIPSLTLEYVFLRRSNFLIYSGIGTYAILENLTLNQETEIELNISTHQYNGVVPFMRAGIRLNRGNFTINPFVGYELQTIYFEEFNEIFSDALTESFQNGNIRTGLRFGILF
tara:strand:+ start:1949 stop:2596 length:648 start_codon:yes stop_codon:yes gene_type:complete